MYRQSSVKPPSKNTSSNNTFRIVYPFYFHYTHQPWLTLNRAKVYSSFKDKLKQSKGGHIVPTRKEGEIVHVLS